MMASIKLYLELLKDSLLGNIDGNQNHINEKGEIINKVTKEDIDEGRYWPEKALTMIGRKRLNNIQFCIEFIIKYNIEGDLIECGVWRGGATIFMKGVLKTYEDLKRKIFVADSFKGLPKPDVKYIDDKTSEYHNIKILSVSKEDVTNNFKKYNLLDDNIIFIKGFFEYSLKEETQINKISLLRIDCDMYSSTTQVLEELYDKVSEGGFIIIDDYCLIPVFKAVNDFRIKRNIVDIMHQVDQSCLFWQKQNL